MNRRRHLLAALGAAVLGAPAGLLAQPRRYRVGFLGPGSEAGARPYVEGFRAGMRELGYVEGRNLEIEFRFGNDEPSRLPAIAAELVQRKPDVIVTGSPPGVRAAKEATGTVPIVIAAVYDPVGQGFVQSLSRPGGNITGLSIQYEDTIPKAFELLAALVPELKSIAVLHTVDASHRSFIARISAMAAPRRIAIRPVEVRAPAELEGAFSALGRGPGEALIVLPHPIFNTRPAVVVELAAARRLPAVYPLRNYAEAGGLLSLGVNLVDSYRRAARFVHRILEGARPADLPVEQPTKMDVVLNLKTSRALGLAAPQSLLLLADRIIE
jgi:putative ABC transport system substrate-binding protein